MPAPTNNRVYYAVHAIGMTDIGNVAAGAVHSISGVQSVGLNTTFNLEQAFQLGQLEIYENIENIPDVEVTIEKVLDGHGLLQHFATPTSTGSGNEKLASRYNTNRTDVYINYYADTVTNAAGTPVAEVYCSGMYVSSISLTFPTDGNATESVTLVGNDKTWRTTGTKADHAFTDAGAPGAGGITRRQVVIMASSIFPSEGILSNGTTPAGVGDALWPGHWTTAATDDDYACYNVVDGVSHTMDSLPAVHIQSISVSTDLGRTDLFELGRRGPYHRFADFPTEVTCAIEMIENEYGDYKSVAGDSDANVVNVPICIRAKDPSSDGFLEIDLGQKNKLASITSTGGDTGGGNRTVTYNYSNFNRLTIIDPQDPASQAHG